MIAYRIDKHLPTALIFYILKLYNDYLYKK